MANKCTYLKRYQVNNVIVERKGETANIYFRCVSQIRFTAEFKHAPHSMKCDRILITNLAN